MWGTQHTKTLMLIMRTMSVTNNASNANDNANANTNTSAPLAEEEEEESDCMSMRSEEDEEEESEDCYVISYIADIAVDKRNGILEKMQRFR